MEEKDYVEFEENGKTFIRTYRGEVCKISYETRSEFLEVVNNQSLLCSRDIWHECKLPKYYNLNLYYTDFGAIKRGYYVAENGNLHHEIVLKQCIHKSGYLQLMVNKDGNKILRITPHTLLAEEKEGRSYNYIEDELSVDHINSIPWYNHISNLRVVSNVEQLLNTNTQKKIEENRCYVDPRKYPSYPVVCVNATTGEVMDYDCIRDALEGCGIEITKNNIKTVGDVIKGYQHTFHGFEFHLWEAYYGKEWLLDGECFKSLDIKGDEYKTEFPSIRSDIQVSNLGRIRCWRYSRWFYCNARLKEDGRYCVSVGGKDVSFSRLVCLFFHPEDYKPGLVVRHLDGDKTNNSPDNLRWGTVRENQIDERYNPARTKSVVALDSDGNIIKRYFSTKEAERVDGYIAKRIQDVCHGRVKAYGGYKWKYEKDYILEQEEKKKLQECVVVDESKQYEKNEYKQLAFEFIY